MIKKYDASKPNDWLKCPEVPADLKQQIKEMSDNQKAKAFSSKQLAFGTAGIRGQMGPGTQLLNKFVYQQMMIGYVGYIKSLKLENPWIVIGHDNRMNSEAFAMTCAEIALANGINVYLFEDNKLMPTPIISFTIRKMNCAGGVNITASHNPKEDNGFKAYNSLGAQVLPNEAKVIVDNMPASKDILNISKTLAKSRAKKGILLYINYDKITDEYFDEVIKRTIINKAEFLRKDFLVKKEKIVFTGFQGTTTELMPKFLKKLGFKHVHVVPGQDKISDKFEGSPISNPENIKAFDQAIEYANKIGATVIFGVDPDGDRLSFGFKKTNRWRFLNGNEMGIIYTYYILKHTKYDKKPFILSSKVSTNYIDRIAKKFNADVYRTKTGFKWMGNLLDKCKETGTFVCAFEEAIGALVHSAARDKDSFGAVALALEIYAMETVYYVDLHEYIQGEIFDTFGDTYSATHSYTVISDDWAKDAKKLMNKALHFKSKKIFDYEIQKVYFDKTADAVVWDLDKDSWIKFRISGTEPKFKVYFCLNNQMVGQLKTSGARNLEIIKKEILNGFKLKA